MIVAAVSGLIDPAAWRALRRVSGFELAIAAIMALGVNAVGVRS